MSNHKLRMRTLWLASIASLTLASCGGGSSNSQQSPIDLNGTPLEYTGKTQLAQLTPQNAYKFMEIAFIFSRSIDGSEFCETGSINLLAGDINEEGIGPEFDENGNAELLLQYSDCQLNGFIVNGQARSKINIDPREVTLVFNSLTLTNKNGETIILSGSVNQESASGCNDYNATYDIVIHDIAADTYYKTENLQIGRSNSCNLYSSAILNGQVYIADYGYIEISTLSPYLYNRYDVNDDAFFPDLTGHIHLAGANSSSADYQLKTKEVFFKNFIGYTIYLVDFNIDTNGDGEPDNSSSLTFSQFNDGASADLGDNDGDGIINSWEIFFGLDPNDPNDANLDKDNDGYSNLYEFQYFGNPSNSEDVPLVTDLSIKLTDSIFDSVRAGQQFRINIFIDNPNTLYGAEDVTFTLVKPVTADWATIPFNCTSINENEIQCYIEYIGRESRRAQNISVITDEVGDYEFFVSVNSATFDYDNSNNSANRIIEIDERSVDLGIRLDEHGRKEHEFAIIDENKNYQIQVTQSGPDEARDTVLSMNIPDNINVESAEFTVHYTIQGEPRIGSCDIGQKLICSLGTIIDNAASYKATIDVEISGASEGIVAHDITISSQGIDPNPNNNSVSFNTFVGKPLTPIQGIIDSAAPR